MFDSDEEDEDIMAALRDPRALALASEAPDETNLMAAVRDPRASASGARWKHYGGTDGTEDHWLLFDTNGRLLTWVYRDADDDVRGGSMMGEDDERYEIWYIREPTFDNAIEWEEAIFAAHPVDDLCVGDHIECRYSDGRMYPATICFGLGQGRYEIRWKDDDDDECGETWNQPLSNIRLIERA